jgi:HPt (histidine-containing phosphotransfer) domain-containing protein
MKTLYEELIDLLGELRDTCRRPGGRAARQQPPPAATGLPAAIPTGTPAGDLQIDVLAREFPRELFARLLLELPEYREQMAASFAAGDYRRLRDSVHQILGATAYCQAEELEQGLRELRRALRTENSKMIADGYQRAMQAIDDTLRHSGHARRG